MPDLDEMDRIAVHALIPGDRFMWAGEMHEVASVRQASTRWVIRCVSGRCFAGQPDAIVKGIAAPRPDTWQDGD